MDEQIRQAIIEHARVEYPRECCGLLVNRGREHEHEHEREHEYFPCKNIAEHKPDHNFTIDPLDYVRIADQGEIIAIVHSHPGVPPLPSQADRVSCEQSGLPWIIVNPLTEQFHEFDPEGYIAPLIGRTFSYGVLDCYTLVRDYYKQELNIDLPNYDRSGEWWHAGRELYMEKYREAGFVKVDQRYIHKHDVLLIQLASKVANHLAIYLGGNMILHHVQKRLSRRDVYGGYWLKNTRLAVRHRSLAEEAKVV